jgi:outer membrane protein OmpA-like peptidoglycan-associated protein
MSFDYNKNKNAHSSDSFWTSYSDLFLGLSTIFLLLYVTASLRTGTDSIRSQIESQKLTMENEELRGQLKMYESIKQNYIDKSAPGAEKREYQELMDKLSLLKDEAKTDSERLARESLENDRKSMALNKYQQMIRNIINANKVAKTKIVRRNDFIAEQDTTIDQQKTDINNLETDIAQKRELIAKGEQKIASTNNALKDSQKKLLRAYRAHQISKKAFDAKNRKLKAEADNKVKQLQAANDAHVQQLQQAFEQEKARDQAEFDQKMAESQMDAAAKEQALLNFQQAAAAKESALAQHVAGLQGKLKNTQGNLAKMNNALAQAQGELNKAKDDVGKLASNMGALEGQLKEKEGNLAQLSGALSQTKGELDKTKGDLGRAQGDVGRLSGALAKAKEEMDARREIAQEIKRGFAGAGIKADIDMQTGEVVLDFGNHYFESDSASLKAEMKEIIERAMPVYSRSLFGNQKIASKISAVEIIGFASPTYQGRFVDPNSNKPKDRAALKYNMDLSYRRANSIFNYLVEEQGPEFEYKHGLMSLMKVSGRSFLEVMKVSGRKPATAGEFCRKNDCKKAQKVIVRFSMDGKK